MADDDNQGTARPRRAEARGGERGAARDANGAAAGRAPSISSWSSPSSADEPSRGGLEGTIDEGISGLQKLFKKRERELDRRESEIKRLKEDFEREHPAFAAKSPEDVLRLNVGGTRIDVLRRTLVSAEGSLLATQFSGRWDESLAKDADGNFFLDLPVNPFLILVNFLRSRELMSPSGPDVPSPSLEDMNADEQICFLRMIDHYGVALDVYPFSLHRVGSNRARVKCVRPGVAIPADGGGRLPSTFALLPTTGFGHGRTIKAFEVAAERGTKAMVGVAFAHRLRLARGMERAGLGPGHFKGSIAIDTSKREIGWVPNSGPPQRHSVSIDRGNFSNGALIRCEDNGDVWHLNGVLVPMPTNVPPFKPGHLSGESVVPVVTVYEGSLRFTSIELALTVT
jgi:hypothetical protein